MRKELYKSIANRLFQIGADGSMIEAAAEAAAAPQHSVQEEQEEPAELEEPTGQEEPAGHEKPVERLIKYVDLWNHNVDFLDQEQPWERPAVFVEFTPIQWEVVKPGCEYRAKPLVTLHVVTDWKGDASAGSELEDETLSVLDYSEIIHRALQGLEGEHFSRFDLAETQTNHNHDEIVESIEVYRCVAVREL